MRYEQKTLSEKKRSPGLLIPLLLQEDDMYLGATRRRLTHEKALDRFQKLTYNRATSSRLHSNYARSRGKDQLCVQRSTEKFS